MKVSLRQLASQCYHIRDFKMDGAGRCLYTQKDTGKPEYVRNDSSFCPSSREDELYTDLDTFSFDPESKTVHLLFHCEHIRFVTQSDFFAVLCGKKMGREKRGKSHLDLDTLGEFTCPLLGIQASYEDEFGKTISVVLSAI